MKKEVEEIARALGAIELSPLTRPNLGPGDPPTLELIQFDLKAYAYSSIAYVRDLLSGLLTLMAAGNVAVVDLAVRGLYEWAMHASYVEQQNRIPIKAGDYAECRRIMDPVQTGNGWVKRHGGKYWKPPFEEEVLGSPRIKHLVKAYRLHQLENYGEEHVEDDYGYLSERAHPNSFCLSDVNRVQGWVLEFVKPTVALGDRGIVPATLLDWLFCIDKILALAGEGSIRGDIAKMLRSFLNRHGSRGSDETFSS